MADGEEREAEICGYTRQGEIMWINVHGRPEWDTERKRVTGIIGAATDVTAQKTIERQRSEGYEKVKRLFSQAVNVIASMTEQKDPYTAGHQRRVAEMAAAIAKEMGLERDDVEGLRVASLVHDLGKAGIPSEILSKPGRLVQEERVLIEMHPSRGFEILKGIESIRCPRPG
ncbi:MAG: HD-GYP domain-containing protein [Terriglobia bacterium]